MTQEQNDIIKCPILLYTSFIPRDDGDTRFCTTIDKFETDMETVLANGYSPISLRDAYECRNGKKAWCEKPLCVIFIGGYENNYSLAFPVLKRLKIPTSIFVSTDLVGVRKYDSAENFHPHFDWKQASLMIQSGLVDIYPMWHAFDQGKPISEVASKISLIKRELRINNSFYALEYIHCTDEELRDLHAIGVHICITDCFHINTDRIRKGMLPSLSVNYTSDVLDIIEQYGELCKIALEKGDAEINEAVYQKPSDSVLSESVSLPIDRNPLARNYLHNAFPLSILQALNKERTERLVLSEYIDVIYKPAYNWYDYHNYLYSSWDCLECKKMTSDLLKINCINVVEYIIRALKLGYYCDVWLDTYYVPGKPGYGCKHMTHGVLIFSYLAETQEFCALSYNSEGHYDELHISVEAVYMGCSNRYFEYLNLLRGDKCEIINYDIREVFEKLYDYINSICHDDNKRFSKKSLQQYYNYNASLKFVGDLERISSKEKNVHMTSLYSFAEHKRLMMWRLKYIAEKEALSIDIDEAYQAVVKASNLIVNMGTKYNMTKNKELLVRLRDIMDGLCNDEAKYINELLDQLRTKLSI